MHARMYDNNVVPLQAKKRGDPRKRGAEYQG